VTTADVTSSTNVYFTPYLGNKVSLYDGTNWKMYSFTELTLALGTLTSGKNYDVFLYDNSGTLTLELSAAWSSDTVRTDALTTQDGVYVKSGATTRRYLGTFRTISTTATCDQGDANDQAAKRFLWNYYNRVSKTVRCTDTTNSWTYTTNTYRQKRASSANQIEVLLGILGQSISLVSSMYADSSSTAEFLSAIGYDSTTTIAAGSTHYRSGVPSAASTSTRTGIAAVTKNVDLGYHYFAELERSSAVGTTTWYGDGGNADTQSGMSGQWLC
jgi:hypothetical protein